MYEIMGFPDKRGWVSKDIPLKGLPIVVGVKRAAGGGPGSTKDLHTHQPGEIEFFVVRAGTATAMVNGKEIRLGIKKDEVGFLMMEDELHAVINKSEDFDFDIIFLKPAPVAP